MDILQKVREVIKDSKTYFVGGSVRDMLLSRPVKDVDLATFQKPREVGEKLLKAFGGNFFPLKEELLIYRLVFKDGGETYQVDILPVFGESLEEDLRRRDFTVNALALPVNGEFPREVIDLFGGRNDLQARIIRMISAENILEDPVRILRGIRLAGELGFAVEQETMVVFKQYIQYIKKMPGERVAEELKKIFTLKPAVPMVDMLFHTGFFEVFNLGLKEGYELYQNYHHSETVYRHLIDTLNRMEELLEDNPLGIRSDYPPYLLKMVAFFHDIGKPGTLSYDKEGRTRFFGHEKESVNRLKPFLDYLNFSHREKRVLTVLIQNHMRLLSLKTAAKVSGEAILRLVHDTGDLFLELILLYLADKGEKARDDLEFLRGLINFYYGYLEFKEGLSGKEIMKTLNLPESPAVGHIKNYLLKAWARGEIRNSGEALDYMRRKFNKR
ncbi:CCA tRNA nucleotidyltransferase [Carboxydothermus hydrogenoformans]|uniref:PolyA polymerase/tRNA nucleotidyltransferase family protein n=1 Tax=Carboxydothermus hydrogenoformans (strain ATCC BAA-161 / DSM 6008 / Z-2901) TaxID=246194 RepID=Q3A9F0_CARHZ|nr:HD domain-containing protein [Carboxydothermus hydrogenoformans]ABB15425.1 polyA polymerase/tRNA nucleotidyltransferase family protein [Carboxydothermus hydrogenoformans Z-2901]